MTTIQLDLPVTTEVIADHLLTSLYDDALLEFILLLDEGVCDVGFTKKLIKKLKKTLKNEESVQPVYAEGTTQYTGNGYPQYEDQ